MQHAAAQPAVAPYEPLAALVRKFGAAARETVALWRRRPAQQRAHLPARLLYMDARMLKDVGAPDWVIDRAEAERQLRRLHIYR